MKRIRFSSLSLYALTITLIIAGGQPCFCSVACAQDADSQSPASPDGAEADESETALSEDGASEDGAREDGASEEGRGNDDSASAESADPTTPPKPPVAVELTPEQEAAAAEAEAKFRDLHQQLIDALTQMRTTHIHFQNGEDQSADARRRYREHRDRFRQLMRETYDAADRLLPLKLVPDAVTFIGTTLKYREDNDIYDVSTLRGCVQLIDGNAREIFLFRGGARSAVCVGDFRLAKKIYEAMGEEHMEEIDKSLMFYMDKIEEQWTAELAARKADEGKELPQVKLSTTRGDIVLELFIDSAPSAVSNFIGLVEDGFYDDLDFYQVMEHLLALTGDPSGNGMGNTGEFLIDEHKNENARHGVRGSLVMAKMPIGETGQFVPNSASSQFAILFLPVSSVSSNQTVFGRVIEGMDVVCSLRRVDPAEKDKKDKVIVPPDRILTAEVIRRPDELPEPKYVDVKQAILEAQRQLHQGHEHAPPQ
tara:strand:+ start:30387 stop:31829 length:1443 start_codon:yes stop_codon:yes gene_type:complete